MTSFFDVVFAVVPLAPADCAEPEDEAGVECAAPGPDAEELQAATVARSVTAAAAASPREMSAGYFLAGDVI